MAIMGLELFKNLGITYIGVIFIVSIPNVKNDAAIKCLTMPTNQYKMSFQTHKSLVQEIVVNLAKLHKLKHNRKL